MIRHLNEARRSELLNKSKNSIKGKLRYDRRRKSAIANTVREYNKIDMNKLFKEGILTLDVKVRGETDNYLVKISFGGLLDILLDQVKSNNDKLELKCIIKALSIAFNRNDIYVYCNCGDYKYRFQYWSTINKYNSGDPQYSNGKKIRNPNDTLGSSCKHILLVLSNTLFLIKVASVINNYIKYMSEHYERLYAEIMFPKIYGKKYEDAVQLNMFDDSDELVSDEETIDTSNIQGVERSRFKKGNTQGIRFTSNNKDEDLMEFDLDDEE